MSVATDTCRRWADDPEFDVMMEVWFENYHAMESAMGEMTTETAQAELSEDEEKLFDRDRTQSLLSTSANPIWMRRNQIGIGKSCNQPSKTRLERPP